MNELALFVSAFAAVFLLGFQSLNVNRGRYLAAFLTSFGLGAINLVVLKLAPTASGLEIAAYISGGPFGIVAAMLVHSKLRGGK
jgi:hypothetical protein